MNFNFKVFSDGVTLAIEQIKKEPLFYILSNFIIGVVSLIVLAPFYIANIAIVNSNMGAFGKGFLSFILSLPGVLIIGVLFFPFLVGMFKSIRASVEGVKPSFPVLLGEYKNLIAYICPALIYSLVGIVLSCIGNIPKLFMTLVFSEGTGVIGGILIMLSVLFMILISIASGLYLTPVFNLLGYDLSTGRLNPKDIVGIKNVFKTFSLPLILWIFLATLVSFLGIIACCVGIFVTVPAGMIIVWHVCRVFRGDDAVTPSQTQEESKPTETV